MSRACFILLISLLIGACGSDTPKPAAPRGGQLLLGTEKREAIALLKSLGAEDIGSGMQVENPDGSPIAPDQVANWIWSLSAYDITVETQYEGGVVSHINLWDWRGRKRTSYHHSLEHHNIDELLLNPDGTIEYSILETFNEGK